MMPDEARKFHGHEDADGCEKCRKFRIPVRGVYHEGYQDGYEAAQRERGPIQAVGKPLPPHFASETPQGRPGS